MGKKFVLIVKYGSGKAAMLTNTPNLTEAIKQFETEYNKMMPPTKCYGLPEIIKAELVPVLYESVYEKKEMEDV